MMKTLVVCFSRSGYTRRVAEQLADTLGADLEAIVESRSRLGPAGYLRSVVEALRRRQPPIAQLHHHPRAYEQVLIGTPVWASHVSSPVRSYLVAHAGDFRRVGFFCTYGGSGADKVLAEMAQLIDRAPVATLKLRDHEIDAGDGEKLARFVHALRAHPA